MRVVHESADGSRVLATDVEFAASLVAKTVGLMGRSSVPEEYALVFEFEPGVVERLLASLPGPLSTLGERARRRTIHMLFVRTPIDVVWVDDGEVVQVRTLAAWRGRDAASADTVIELAPGAADGVESGDAIRLERDGTDG